MADAFPLDALDADLARVAAADGTLSLGATQWLAARHGCERRQVEVRALERGIVPRRYQRNVGTAGMEGQRRLLQATVAIIGCGGLGGWVAEALARMGVGHLILVDGDRTEESNLNRQLCCVEAGLGEVKVEALGRRVREVNGAVDVAAHVCMLSADSSRRLLAGADVVVDCLDTLPARFDLQRAAAALGVPMVHGAIGGYTGHVTTILPGDPGLAALYGGEPVSERGVEVSLGNPPATPMMVAAWQVHEVVKILLGQGALLRNRVLLLDAEWGEVTEITLGDTHA